MKMGNWASLPFAHVLNILLRKYSGRSAEVYMMLSLRVPKFPSFGPYTEINKTANVK